MGRGEGCLCHEWGTRDDIGTRCPRAHPARGALQFCTKKGGGYAGGCTKASRIGRAAKRLEEVKKKAATATIAAIAVRKGDRGETLTSKARHLTEAISPDGKKISYKRESDGSIDISAGAVRGYGNTASRYAQHKHGLEPSRGESEEDKKRRRRNRPWLKCNKKGHEMNNCRAEKWCPIMRDSPKAWHGIAKYARVTSDGRLRAKGGKYPNARLKIRGTRRANRSGRSSDRKC